MKLIGVNISGGEYGSIGSNRPNWDYVMPTSDDIGYFASKGMNVIRVPLQLERLQPSQNGSLSKDYLGELDRVVSQAAIHGVEVIIDPHNYGSAYGNEIGTSGTPVEALQDFWSKVAIHYKDSSNVIFGLMNEPNLQTGAQWGAIDQKLVDTIRNTGATQEILAPGTGYTSAAIWQQAGNEAPLAALVDPLHKTTIEVHMYLDQDSSGTHFDPITDSGIGISRLTEVTNWAESNHLKLFLGEIGVPSDSQSLAALDKTMDYMQTNSVWEGETYWAAGDWWGDYAFSVQPQGSADSYADKPQMAVLMKYAALARAQATATTPSVEPLPTDTGLPATLPVSMAVPVQFPVGTSSDSIISDHLKTTAPASVSKPMNVAYRFFDQVNGTQFLASNDAEKDLVVSTRPDLKLEGKAFSTVEASDPSAVQILRFFDTHNGTHFYTSSEDEMKTVMNTRPDLVFEGAAFSEHSTKQADDISVFRFFDAVNGTHVYTQDAGEAASLASIRPDLKAEGIAFYVPVA